MHVERDFNDFWKPILKQRGVDPATVPEAIKCLLYEYHFLQEQAIKVYDEVTGGRVDSLSWAGWAIIEEYKKHLTSMGNVCHALPSLTQEDVDAFTRAQHEQLQIQAALCAISASQDKCPQADNDVNTEQ